MHSQINEESTEEVQRCVCVVCYMCVGKNWEQEEKETDK